MTIFKNTLLQVTKNGLGSGDEALGLQLITNYFRLLSEETEPPQFIVFYNGGVKLICKGSPVIEFAKTLEEKGVRMIACKTCLNHFDLMANLDVGIAGSMMDIIELQKMASKVIAL